MRHLTIEVSDEAYRKLEELERRDGIRPAERAGTLVATALALPGVARSLWRAFTSKATDGKEPPK